MSFSVRPFQADLVGPPANLAELQWPEGFWNRPVDLEIGCGVGWHPIRYALENSDRSLIAIEHTREKFEKFLHRFETHGSPSNLLPIHADALRWVTHALKPQTLDRALLLYPNPEPKAANKRWLRMPFMHQLLQTLKPDGELILATNEEVYFNEALEWAEKAWHLRTIEKRAFNKETAPAGIPRTHFEKKYLLRGETCFDVRWSKT